MMSALRISGFILLAVGSSLSAFGDDEPAQRQFFESKIRPLLIEKCQSCHEGDKPESKFRLDSLEGLLTGGTRGPAIVPGKPAESLLISSVKHGEVLKMPPKEKLTALQIADLTKWIETGAFWPDTKSAVGKPTTVGFAEPEFPEEQRSFWAFQPPRRPDVPTAGRPGEVGSPIDRFLDVPLSAAGFTPALPADKRTLLRRATFDLIGLPPAPDELAEFLADESPDAFQRMLDRLLASPHYGVKWGRHWLDVARYGDSNGLDENLSFANAFRYRDYVVQAFNSDKPYDLFVQEQLAGDLLGSAQDPESLDRIVATGFLAIGPKMLAEDDPVKMHMDIIDEQVDTIGKAFLGMTFGCARCHHHKFDPISMHDYYALAGMFKSTKTMETFSVVARWHERPLASPDHLNDWKRQQAVIGAKQQQIQQLVTQTNEQVLTTARSHLGEYLLAATQQQRLDALLAARKPFGEQDNSAQLPGAVFFEAENFIRGNVLKDVSSYGKGIGVLVNKGEQPNFAEYEFELAEAGNFQVELRYAAADARPCRMFVNGREIKADSAGKTTGGWMPEHQKWQVEGIFELPAGKIVLRIEHPVFFPHIDKLLLVPVPDLPTPAKFVRLDPKFVPLPTFVQQWQKFLAEPPLDLAPPLEDWRTATAKLPEKITEPDRQQLQELAARYQEQGARAAADKRTDDPLGKILFASPGPFTLPDNQEIGYPQDVAAELKSLREEKSRLEGALPKFPEAMAVSESTAENLRIHFRGSHLTLGDVVPRRFPKIMGQDGAAVELSGSGRLEFARWLTQPAHPLTSRVMVNRIWTWHFGQGLVRSVDNFGLLGELPTHPELLDWLATEFPRREWSVKSLHRELLSSSAYHRSGQGEARQSEMDPENRLWGRFSRRRMQIEELRDAILFAAGTLDDRLAGSHLTTPNRQYVTSTANVNPDIYRIQRRSIYLPVVRSALYEVFQAFDFADPNVSSGRRESTTVAPQALFLMNSEFVAQQTLAWAEAMLAVADHDDSERLKHVYRRVLGREPRSEEVARAKVFLAAQAASFPPETPAAEVRRRTWQSLCRAVISTNENVFID